MARLVQYDEAGPEVRAVYDEIKAARNIPDVNNFWKAIAVHPATLRRTWDSLRAVMGPGSLDPLTKEMLYLAVSAANGCGYCTASHAAAARGKGMTEEMRGELLAIVAMAAETNRLAEAYAVPIDPAFRDPA
jgi:AhpD family alkylhydroperoxidase